ncbi:MAG: hypothetical protein AAFP84_18095 [Actinomycetota bacterium]
MEHIEVEVLTEQHNFAVIKLPSRRYPGVVLQGDSLAILVHDLLGVREALERSDIDVAVDGLADVVERLQEVKSSYERALSAHEIKKPYS